jgi:hypothetical protein
LPKGGEEFLPFAKKRIEVSPSGLESWIFGGFGKSSYFFLTFGEIFNKR